MYTTHDRYVKMFTSLDEDVGDHEHVTFGDNSKRKVVDLGKVAITKDLSREKKISRLSLENGSPMGNPQMKIQVMMNPRRR